MLFFYVIWADDDEIPQEMLLGKHQLNELGSESAKIKAMGISSRVLLYSISIKSIILINSLFFCYILGDGSQSFVLMAGKYTR